MAVAEFYIVSHYRCNLVNQEEHYSLFFNFFFFFFNLKLYFLNVISFFFSNFFLQCKIMPGPAYTLSAVKIFEGSRFNQLKRCRFFTESCGSSHFLFVNSHLILPDSLLSL